MAYEYEDGNSEYILGNIRLLRAKNEPCIVCGHPTGDCGTEEAKPHHIWGTTEIPSMADENLVLVERDVIEYRNVSPFTKRKVIVAHAGQHVSASRARELGIL